MKRAIKKPWIKVPPRQTFCAVCVEPGDLCLQSMDGRMFWVHSDCASPLGSLRIHADGELGRPTSGLVTQDHFASFKRGAVRADSR